MKTRRTMPRPRMPVAIRLAAVHRNMVRNGGHLVCAETGDVLTEDDILNERVHIDHDPPLKLRYFDPATGKYEPDANDLRFLEVVGVVGHLRRTNLRRGLNRGDQTEIARMRRRRGETKPKPKRKWPSRPIQSRKFAP